MSRIITGFESWVYKYDPETKQQSPQWKSPSSPQPNKARISHSSTKTMLIMFFNIRGIVHREFVPQGQTVNTKFYCESSAAFEGEHSAKATGFVACKNWVLHNNNAPCH
jgi:histone-lysine N-methyltransferase SETMAR